MNPDNEKGAPGSPAHWIIHAGSDLRLGRLGAGDPAVLRAQVCFHAQQVAEKALRAVLLSREIEFPHTRDIKGLLRIAETNAIAVPPAIKRAALLTPYAVETRYPGDWMEITEFDAQEALQIAEHTILWANNMLASGGKGT